MSLDLVDQSCSGESHECSIGEASGSYLNGFFAVWMGCVLKKAAANGKCHYPKGLCLVHARGTATNSLQIAAF